MKRLFVLPLAVLVVAASPAAAHTPDGFFGVMPQSQLTAGDFHRIQGTVETVRVFFSWPTIEPRPGGWDFEATDSLVVEAARHGIHVAPVLYGTPSWLTEDSAEPPRGSSGRAAWRQFVKRVVSRYGQRGFFWRTAQPRLPIRGWQVWNEPNFVLFWRPHPKPRAYAQLLKETALTIRRQDPGATVIAAGIAPVRGGISPWRFLDEMYAVPGIARYFDVAALHPYTRTAQGVGIEIGLTRAIMAAAGDGRKPLLISEVGIDSGPDGGTRNRRSHRQADFLSRTLGMLVAKRRAWRIAGVDWFSWQDGEVSDPYCTFCRYAGLVTVDRRPKPAWRAYRSLARKSKLSTGD